MEHRRDVRRPRGRVVQEHRRPRRRYVLFSPAAHVCVQVGYFVNVPFRAIYLPSANRRLLRMHGQHNYVRSLNEWVETGVATPLAMAVCQNLMHSDVSVAYVNGLAYRVFR